MALYADVLKYRELFLDLLRRDMRVKYRGSLLGIFWSLLHPLVLMGVYTLVFSLLWQIISIKYYPLFLLTGLLVWAFFQASLQTSTTSLVAHTELVKQVRFPRQLLPLSVVATNLITFAVMLAVIVPLNLLLLPETRSTFWLAIPLALPLVALVSGLSIVVASANVLFRDVEHLLTAALLPWFFLTPVFYPLDELPGALGEYSTVASIMHWGNFVVPALESIRDPLFYGRLPAPGDVLYSTVAAVASLGIGAYVFSRIDDRMAAEL